MMRRLVFAYVIFAAFATNDSLRILAHFPVPSISHQIVFIPIIQELLKKGHEVVVITSDPEYTKEKAPANLTEIDVHDPSYEIWKKFQKISGGRKSDYNKQMNSYYKIITEVFTEQIKKEAVQSLLKDKNQKFDLLLLESCVPHTLAWSHIYKVPAIQISTLGGAIRDFEAMGAPLHPFLYPDYTSQRLFNLTMWEKIEKIYKLQYVVKMQYDFVKYIDKSVEISLGEGFPSVMKLRKNVALYFANMHPIWDNNRPVPPNIVYLGGLHQKPPKALPKDLQHYLDSSKNGVIYISFGSNVRSTNFSPTKVTQLANVLSQLPYDVLWKWDKEAPVQAKNMRVGKWFPQSDLLRHPKVKLFVTQGGLQSTDEAITAGVPLVGIPMLVDQWYNTEMYMKHGIGVQLDLSAFSEESFMKAINTVIGNESYRQNIIRLHDIMHDQPEPPLTRAIWWIEYVARRGGDHLRAAGHMVPVAEYYELALLVTVLAVTASLLALVAILGFLAVSCVSKFCLKLKKD